MQKSRIHKQHKRNSSIQTQSTNLRIYFRMPQTEKEHTWEDHIFADFFPVFQYYRARALAWACRRAAVSVWEPCMAIQSAVCPRWVTEGKKMLNSEPIFSLTQTYLKNTFNFSYASRMVLMLAVSLSHLVLTEIFQHLIFLKFCKTFTVSRWRISPSLLIPWLFFCCNHKLDIYSF